MRAGDLLWTPSEDRAADTRMAAFLEATGHPDTDSLHAWSVHDPDGFWRAAWDLCGVVGDPGDRVVAPGDDLPTARFFPDATLNVAENLLRRDTGQPAVIFRGEDPGVRRELSWWELRRAVGRVQEGMRRSGVGPGDVVAAWMPNTPETYVVMLAAASLGAIFTSTSPDFGVDGVIDRFGQVRPKMLFGCDAYYYGGKVHDRAGVLHQVVESLPSVERSVVVGFTGSTTPIPGMFTLDELIDDIPPRPPDFVRLPFDHPWYVLFSSGTTGKPKCIRHRAGGVLIKHLVEHQLHCDVRPDDRVFYFTTAGWMMWNWLASALASEATLVLYDGSPFHPDPHRLFDVVDEVGVTLFGTSAKFIESMATERMRPRETHDLGSLRTVCSTGSTLAPEGFSTIYDCVKPDVHLASISGGTDLCGCLVAGDPTRPVHAGEIQGPALGLAIEVVDAEGTPLPPGERGELTCASPFPSMPLGFVDDPDATRYRAAYFDRFPGRWHQGDYAERTDHGGFVIHGRSDATLNPGGVRIGTAEIYRQVDKVDEVVDAVVIGQQQGADTRIVLFVVLAEGVLLDDALVARIRSTVRDGATPRHVPAVVAEVPEIPRTRSGKIVELAVRDVVHGRPVANTAALANPETLAAFADHPALG